MYGHHPFSHRVTILTNNPPPQWKVLVVDPDSRRLIDNVIDQDVILNEKIMSIELITDRRPTNRDADAMYLITPQPWIVDCVMADLEKRKYRTSHLVWTSCEWTTHMRRWMGNG